ncbi:MAG: 1,4-dihydroxy-2-naphthoate polyprenyltransferase [Deltaproteobacteria bacterium]|nr:1,4-dihydroxy-2-naphthoate polyprenyltransferase [Deltaproteobacteria bacterium]
MTIVKQKPIAIKALWLAARPATLPAGCVPVIVGSGVALGQGGFSPFIAIATLFGAIFIQIGTNYFNDYADFKKGADTSDRLGPLRATQQGWLSAATVLKAALLSFAIAALFGIFLILTGGWPIAIVGIASIIAGIAYTGGPWPLAYVGLGDVFVFIFFGPIAVVTTYFLQVNSISFQAWLAAIPVGLLATAILVVNNLRDCKTDKQAGKKTLVVRFGSRAARIEYTILIALSYSLLIIGWFYSWLQIWCLLPLFTLPLALKNIRAIFRLNGRALNPYLALTAKLELFFGITLAIGALL